MKENNVKSDRTQMEKWHMRSTAYWIPKTTNTHSEYILIIGFILQKWLYGRVSILRHLYIDCLVFHISPTAKISMSSNNLHFIVLPRDIILAVVSNQADSCVVP
jgi:hypothetical protein